MTSPADAPGPARGANRILRVEPRAHSLVPARAEVHVVVVPERMTATTEVRGRLMGPSCRFASTVEVAYHFRPLPAAPEGTLAVRCIIPEASLWEPASPFLYEGPVELWEEGQRLDLVRVRCGLRSRTLGPRGLRVNGRLLELHGRAVADPGEDEALALRQRGCNLLLTPVRLGCDRVWELADRLGFFVLGTLERWTGTERDLVGSLAHRPSSLGWLFESGLEVPAELGVMDTFGGLVAARVDGSGEVPGEVGLVVGSAEAVRASQHPGLVEGREAKAEGGLVLGWVESA
jgi:hypothetical protein